MFSEFFSRDDGTASVEIVVMLPLFIALFFAVSYLHRLGAAGQDAKNAARACVWAHALNGCEGKLPAVCTVLGLGPPEGLRFKLPGGELEVTPDGQVHLDESYFDAIASIPILGSAVKSVFGVGKRIKATREFEGYMAGDDEIVTASNYVLCNVKAETWSDKIGGFFDWLKDCKGGPLCK